MILGDEGVSRKTNDDKSKQGSVPNTCLTQSRKSAFLSELTNISRHLLKRKETRQHNVSDLTCKISAPKVSGNAVRLELRLLKTPPTRSQSTIVVSVTAGDDKNTLEDHLEWLTSAPRDYVTCFKSFVTTRKKSN